MNVVAAARWGRKSWLSLVFFRGEIGPWSLKAKGASAGGWLRDSLG